MVLKEEVSRIDLAHPLADLFYLIKNFVLDFGLFLNNCKTKNSNRAAVC